jgi:hypothetical protein
VPDDHDLTERHSLPQSQKNYEVSIDASRGQMVGREEAGHYPSIHRPFSRPFSKIEASFGFLYILRSLSYNYLLVKHDNSTRTSKYQYK